LANLRASATSRPRLHCPCTLAKNCVPCLYYATSSHAVCKADAPFTDHPPQVASSVPLGTRYYVKYLSNRLPRGRKFLCKRARPNRPGGQVKSRLHASLPLSNLGEPRASHTICSMQASRWGDDGYYQGSRSNVIPRFRVLGKRPLVVAARSFHRIELYLALSSH
jgi:hypothetical protein